MKESPHNSLTRLEIPKVEVKKPVHLRKVSISTLDNGLLVVSQDPIGIEDVLTKPFDFLGGVLSPGRNDRPHEFGPDDAVRFTFTVKAGSRDDPDGKEGLAHMLEHLLYGTGKIWDGGQDLMQKLTELGLECNASTSADRTRYYVVVPRKHAATAFGMIADSLRYGLIDQAEAGKEPGVIKAEMAMIEDDFYRESLLGIINVAYGNNHEKGNIIGTRESVASITPEDLKAFHAQYYTPANMAVSSSGAIHHHELLALSKKHFGMAKKGERAPTHEYAFSPVNAVVERPTSQLSLNILLPSIHKHSPNAQGAHLAVGYLLSQAIWQKLRENGGIYYSLTRLLDWNNPDLYDSLIFIPTVPEHVEKVVQVIGEVLRNPEGAIVEKDFERLKQDIIKEIQQAIFEMNFNDAHDVAEDLLLTESALRRTRLHEVLESLQRLSFEDMQEALAQLTKGEPAMLAYGPVAKAEELAGKSMDEMFFTPVKEALAQAREKAVEAPQRAARGSWLDEYDVLIKERASSILKSTINDLPPSSHFAVSKLIAGDSALKINHSLLKNIKNDNKRTDIESLKNTYKAIDEKDESIEFFNKDLTQQLVRYWLKDVPALPGVEKPLVLISGMEGSGAERMVSRLPSLQALHDDYVVQEDGQKTLRKASVLGGARKDGFWHLMEYALGNETLAPSAMEQELQPYDAGARRDVAVISQDALFDLITGRDAARLPRGLSKALKPVREWLEREGFVSELDKRIVLSPLLEALEAHVMKAAISGAHPVIWHGHGSPEEVLKRADIAPMQLANYKPCVIALHGEQHVMAEECAKRWEYSRGGLPALAMWNSHANAAEAWRSMLDAIARGGEILPALPIWLAQTGFNQMEGQPEFKLAGKRAGEDITWAAGLSEKLAGKLAEWFAPGKAPEATRLSDDQKQAEVAVPDSSIGTLSGVAAALHARPNPAAL
jgi:zinc protease